MARRPNITSNSSNIATQEASGARGDDKIRAEHHAAQMILSIAARSVAESAPSCPNSLGTALPVESDRDSEDDFSLEKSSKARDKRNGRGKETGEEEDQEGETESNSTPKVREVARAVGISSPKEPIEQKRTGKKKRKPKFMRDGKPYEEWPTIWLQRACAQRGLSGHSRDPKRSQVIPQLTNLDKELKRQSPYFGDVEDEGIAANGARGGSTQQLPRSTVATATGGAPAALRGGSGAGASGASGGRGRQWY